MWLWALCFHIMQDFAEQVANFATVFQPFYLISKCWWTYGGAEQCSHVNISI